MNHTNPLIAIYLPLASTIVVSVATVVLVWFTARYVRLTSHLVEETRRAREPFVSLEFEIPDNALIMVIANGGQSAAKNIRFEVIRDAPWLELVDGSTGLTATAPIKNGIPYLTPGRKFNYHLGFPHWNEIPADHNIVSIKATYEDDCGKQFQSVMEYNFDHIRGVFYESYRHAHLKAARAMRETEQHRQSHERRKSLIDPYNRRRPAKKCPSCAEFIPEEARKCSHCWEELG
jgi:hypothetical protein